MEHSLFSLLIALIVFACLFAVIAVIPMVEWLKKAANILVGAIAAIYCIRWLVYFLF